MTTALQALPCEGTSRFHVAADHPCLAGHFPGRPVVPGVVIVDAVRACLDGCWGDRMLLGLPQFKFLRPLLPDEPAPAATGPLVELELIEFRTLQDADVRINIRRSPTVGGGFRLTMHKRHGMWVVTDEQIEWVS